MKSLLLVGLLTGCATPNPVPDIFSPEAHQGTAAIYRPIQVELWSYGYDPVPVADGPRYLVPVDGQDYEPGDVPDADYSEVRGDQ